jgi:hypothetical protein
MVMLSLVNRRCLNWNLYVARAAARGTSERAALAMVERAELVTRLEAAGVVNIGADQSVADLRAVARELSKAGALPRRALRFMALLVALFLAACGAPAPGDFDPCAAPVPDFMLIAVLDPSSPPECGPAYNPTSLSSACELWGGALDVDVPLDATGGPADGVWIKDDGCTYNVWLEPLDQ